LGVTGEDKRLKKKEKGTGKLIVGYKKEGEKRDGQSAGGNILGKKKGTSHYRWALFVSGEGGGWVMKKRGNGKNEEGKEGTNARVLGGSHQKGNRVGKKRFLEGEKKSYSRKKSK